MPTKVEAHAAGVGLDVDGTELARLLIVGTALGVVAVTDLAEHRIPNRIVVQAAIACAVLLPVEGGAMS